MNPYQQLAQALDTLPNGFPPTPDGAELRLLEKLYTPEEAALTAQLSPHLESSEEIASRLGFVHAELRKTLKSLTKRGLIEAGRTEKGFLVLHDRAQAISLAIAAATVDDIVLIAGKSTCLRSN